MKCVDKMEDNFGQNLSIKNKNSVGYLSAFLYSSRMIFENKMLLWQHM